MEQARRLGRGLDALLGEPPVRAQPAKPISAPLALIHRNPRNPRRDFGPEELEDLAASIRTHGVVQPLVVRRRANDRENYELIAGERRWRAAQMAGLHDVPITLLDVDDRQALEIAIVENVQRADLNPVEEARGYQALIEEFGYTQGDLGAVIGKSRAHVANTLRLLKLPTAVLARLESGELSAGHGRALITAADPEALARQVAERSLSVRDTERLSQSPAEKAPSQRAAAAAKPADIRALENDLSQALGLAVQLHGGGKQAGEIRIAYTSLDQLEAICRKLKA